MRLRGQRSIRTQRRGFTLLETALAMIIVMVGVVAMVEAQGSFLKTNSWSSHEATATYLANEIRERMRDLPRHDPVTGLTLVNGQLQGWGPEAGEVSVTDFDDVDDYDGLTFGAGGNFEGPIDAFGRVIPETDVNGLVVIDPTTGQPLAMQGWSQVVRVQKVDPYNFSSVRANNATDAPSGNFPGRAVDQFPLRVTVSVFYQDPLSVVPDKVTEVNWIVPAN
jgi:type II secretory pathway pseudopilin PulG